MVKRSRYSAQFIDDFASLSLRLERKPILGMVWRVVLPLIIGWSYLGAALATIWGETLPFQFLAWFGITPNTKLYWVVSLIDIATIAFLCVILAAAIYRRFKKQCVDIDLIVLFTGTVLALWFALLIVRHGF